MSVLRIPTTVIKSVLTLKVPSPVPVTVDIHSQVMEDHAMVCHWIQFVRCDFWMGTQMCLINSNPTIYRY